MDVKSLSGRAYIKELERRSRDTLMVYNPTDQDFPVVWEGMTEYVVPANSKDKGYGLGRLPVPRYIAEKYAREMAIFQINVYAKEIVSDYKKKYTGSPTEWPKIEENLAPRTNDTNLLKKYMTPLIVGIVKEYGFEPGVAVEPPAPPSGNTIEKDIFDELVTNLSPVELGEKKEENKVKDFTQAISE